MILSLPCLHEAREGFSTRTRQTTAEKNAADTDRLEAQLSRLGGIGRYTYGTGSNYGRGVLGHDDVLQMASTLILENKLLPRLVARQYPFIFVDESQDTFDNVVRALKRVSAESEGQLCLGFFGDPMQQIYQRGVGEITLELGWRKIEKPENFRSSDKVLSVINKVRSEGDELVQIPGRAGDKRVKGECFFFVLPADGRRTERLRLVQAWLDRHSSVGRWRADGVGKEGAKILMITHRMVAKRLGFEQLYSVFHDGRSQSLRDAFDEGNAWPLRQFKDVIFPLCDNNDSTAASVIELLREHGGALSGDLSHVNMRQELRRVRVAIDDLRKLVSAGGAGSVGAVLRHAINEGIFAPDARWSAFLNPQGQDDGVVLSDELVQVLNDFVKCDVTELTGYLQYVSRDSPYSTQHGTKGTEFRKVLVVLDDEEGQFPLFSYEKLLGLKPLTSADIQRRAENKESVLERTRRLLYVCVSRAMESLAVVLFAPDVEAAAKALEAAGISTDNKVLTLADISGDP